MKTSNPQVTHPMAIIKGWVDPIAATSPGGAGETVFDHGSMGATETIDLEDGTWHRGTLDANCAITVQGFTVDQGVVAVFEVAQDGTGGFGITWDGDVTFVGDDQPDLTASTTTVFLLFSSAGDSLIYGAKVGGGSGTDLSAIDFLVGTASGDLSAEIVVGTTPGGELGGTWSSPTVDTTHSGSSHASIQAAAEATAAAALAAALLTVAGGAHAHVVSEVHLSNGSATTYTLDQTFEPGSVIAWNTTSLARLGVTEAAPDQATVSAAGSSGDSIVFDYAATIL